MPLGASLGVQRQGIGVGRVGRHRLQTMSARQRASIRIRVEQPMFDAEYGPEFAEYQAQLL